MPLASKSGLLAAVALPLLLAAGGAAADERCTGTLCDLYYGGPPPQPAPNQASQAPKPVTVPSGGILGFFSGNKAAPAGGTAAAPASRPMVSVGGGGLLGAFRGGAQERCTGTLCDLYYGGPPPEKPEAAQPTPARAAEATAQAAPAAMAETPAEALPPLPETRESPKRCIAKGGDPWSCFRH